ncbi:MAG: hypothetical protein Q4C60_07760 [Eubacteriales bacterium]|nr:hypothetical protein [Eubacteriales bacterium]
MSKLVLKNGTEITLKNGAALGAMAAHYADRAAMLADWEQLTADNLSSVQITDEGVVTGNYTDLVLASETSTVNADETVDTVWAIREKTDIEKLQESQARQDTAIDNLVAAQLM